MAFRFAEPGARIYQVMNSYLNTQAWWTNNLNSTSIIPTGGRYGGSCLRLAYSGGNIYKFIDSQPILGVTAAVKITNMPNSASALINFFDGNLNQCELRWNPLGNFSVTRNGTLIASTVNGLFHSNVWVHVELKITFHPTAGAIYLAVNGVERLNLINQNTRNTVNSSANGLLLDGGWSALAPVDFDDVIVYDSQPTDANNYPSITGPIGDCHLGWYLPNDVGSLSQFTPNIVDDNYTRVDNPTPNSVDYVESSTIGHIDTYRIPNISATIVKSLAIVHHARKIDSGSRGIKAVIRSGGSNTIHAKQIALPDNYVYSFSEFAQNPNNSPWTPAAVNAIEIGQIVFS